MKKYIAFFASTGTYFTLIMVMTGLSVVLTVIVLNVHFRGPGTHIMYPWVSKPNCGPKMFLFPKNRVNGFLSDFCTNPRFGRSYWSGCRGFLRVDRPQSKLKSERDLTCDSTSCCCRPVPTSVDRHGSTTVNVNGMDLEERSASLLGNVLQIDDRSKANPFVPSKLGFYAEFNGPRQLLPSTGIHI